MFKGTILKFINTKIQGVFNIELDRYEDERGFFARVWDKTIFEKNKLNSSITQCSISVNKTKGTIRGLHYLTEPYFESKIVRCIKGKVFNVVLDLRKNSPTYKQWDSIILSADNYISRYIPDGCANGIQTLEDNTDVLYQMSRDYVPHAERGIRWDDPNFKIKWPLTPTEISIKDRSWENF
jgi:dTDP-4-dehydrorhamnose 3,5-epimerase